MTASGSTLCLRSGDDAISPLAPGPKPKRTGVPCPRCGCVVSDVHDSRANASGVRRRRWCVGCGHRYTTLEQVALTSVTNKLAISIAEAEVEARVKARIERILLEALRQVRSRDDEVAL